jgi:signal transduction histidine kinase
MLHRVAACSRLRRIAREALCNAFRHAQADRIEAEVVQGHARFACASGTTARASTRNT